MDLGIAGRRAIVCAASRGLGRACARALAAEGAELVISAREPSQLEATAREIARDTGVKVATVAGDLVDERTRRALVDACPAPDILVTNCGGAPPGDFRAWQRDDWIRALDANMLTAISLIQQVIDGMRARKFGRIVNITNVAAKGGYPELSLSAGALGGLTAVTAALARETVATNVTINNLMPGRFETDRLRSNIRHDMQRLGVPMEEVARARLGKTPAGRFGDPAEFGAVCAFFCSQHVGYVTGQNLVVDGGSYAGIY